MYLGKLFGRTTFKGGYWHRYGAVALLLWGWTASTVDGQVLPRPSEVTASRGTYPGGVRLTWTHVAGAGAYDIWRNTEPDWQTADYLSSVGGSRNEFVDETIPANTSFYYWVRTVSAPGVSSHFGPWQEGYWVPGPPPPLNVQASDGSFAHRIRVTWNASLQATSYQVWRNTADDRHASTLVATTTARTFNDTDIDPLGVYYYWIKASNAEGTSAFSEVDSGFAEPKPPAKVANLQASQGQSLDHIRVHWDAVPGGQYYDVWRSEDGLLSSSMRVVTQLTETEFLDDTVPPGTAFTYWVRAVNSLGFGTFSEPASGYRETALPERPLFVTASRGMYADGIRLAWQASPHALEYEILRNVPQRCKNCSSRISSTPRLNLKAGFAMAHYSQS